jgi:hypothetical protein
LCPFSQEILHFAYLGISDEFNQDIDDDHPRLGLDLEEVTRNLI